MRLSRTGLNSICRQQGRSIASVLRRASISRTAYYNLLSKRELLPRSVYRLAEALQVAPKDLLQDSASAEEQMRQKMIFVEGMAKSDKSLDVGTAINTLRFLELSPTERLNQGLRYGHAAITYR